MTLETTSTNETEKIGQARTTVFSAIFLTTLTCNLLALYVLHQRKTNRPSLKFTLMLCLENAIIGGSLLLFIIIFSITNVHIDDNSVWCHTSAILFIMHIVTSAWTGLLISLDRFIAVKNSLRYNNWITNRTCLVLITLTIIISLGISLLQLSEKNKIHYHPNLSICLIDLSPTSMHWKLYNLLIVLVACVLPLFSNCYIYWSIYRATKNTTALARRNSFPATENNHKDEEDKESLHPTARQSIRKLSGQLIVHKDNRKAAKMGALVVLAEIFLIFPFFMILILSVLNYIESSSFHWLAVACLFFDCTANPVVYVLRNKSARSILTSCKGSKHCLASNKGKCTHTQTSIFFRLVASQSSNDSIQTISQI